MAGKANPRFEQALAFAAQAHAAVHQERKGTDFPYVAHPIRVAEILDRFECSEDVIVAGFLHDTIEDTDVTADEISATFSPRIAGLVTSVSEPDKSLPWKTQKAAHDRAPRAGAGSGGACAGGRRQARQRPRDHRHAASSRAGEDVGPLQSGPERAALLLPAHRGDSAAEGSGEPAVQDARLRDADALPRSGTLDDLLRREAASATLTTHGHTSPTRSSTGVPTTLRSSSPRSGSRRRGFPPSVVRVLSSCDTWAGCRLVEGLFEREVDLGTRGRPSQTDLLALVQLTEGGYGVIAVEGKAREPFGPLVSEWNDSPGKQARLESLCEQLGLDPRCGRRPLLPAAPPHRVRRPRGAPLRRP